MLTRDEMPDGTRRLQPTDSRPVPSSADVAAPTSPTGAPEGLRRAIVERHGEVLGGLLFEAELKNRAGAVERFQRLQARIEALRTAKDLRTREGQALLVPLHAAMESARAAWEDACAAHERQRLQNQSRLSPLENQISEIITELNRPLIVDRARNWRTPDWYQAPLNEFPRLPIGPTKKPDDY